MMEFDLWTVGIIVLTVIVVATFFAVYAFDQRREVKKVRKAAELLFEELRWERKKVKKAYAELREYDLGLDLDVEQGRGGKWRWAVRERTAPKSKKKGKYLCGGPPTGFKTLEEAEKHANRLFPRGFDRNEWSSGS